MINCWRKSFNGSFLSSCLANETEFSKFIVYLKNPSNLKKSWFRQSDRICLSAIHYYTCSIHIRSGGGCNKSCDGSDLFRICKTFHWNIFLHFLLHLFFCNI